MIRNLSEKIVWSHANNFVNRSLRLQKIFCGYQKFTIDIDKRMLYVQNLRCILHREKSFYENFHEDFWRFREVFRSVREFFEAFRRIRTHSDPFGPIGMHSDAFGSIWNCLDVFEHFRGFLNFWSIFQCCGRNFTKMFFTAQHVQFFATALLTALESLCQRGGPRNGV